MTVAIEVAFVLAALVSGGTACLSATPKPAPASAAAETTFSLTTPDRLEESGWWPTKGQAPLSAYVGTATCVRCHEQIGAQQQGTSMFHAASRADQSAILKQHDALSLQQGSYSYKLSRGSSGTTFAVNAATSSAVEPVRWAFGVGNIGQTYLLEKDGRYTEGRLSYYTSLSRLDITTGQSPEPPSDVEQALGHALSRDTTMQCFGCHTTAAVTSGKFDPARATPGLGCEACHGPGAAHVAAMTGAASPQAATAILNPAALSPLNSVDFCGACHRTASDVSVLLPPDIGLASLRFEPYRLEKSRCWGREGDARLTCVACHDPHQPLVRELASYDSRCLACHAAGAGKTHAGIGAAVCKVSTHDCASCHMPKYEVPQTHARFTDHDIRVVRPGEPFPL